MVTRFPVSNELVSLRDVMDRFVSDAFSTAPFRTLWATGDNGNVRLALPLDVYGTNDEIVILAAVPGIDPNDLELTINKNTITISGTMPNVARSEEAKDATWYLHELASGTFSRSVTLPVEVDANRAEATFEHGVLRLSIPKAEAAKPRRIEIRSAQSAPEAISASQS